MKSLALKITLGLGATLLLSACSEGGVLKLKDPLRLSRKAAPGSEFVSASTQYQTTANGYKVQQTTGAFTSKMRQTSSPSGYKVYYSVQGAVISDEL